MDAHEPVARLPLNIYLLKADVENPEVALELSAFLGRVDLRISQDSVVQLYVSRTEGVPQWLSTLSQLAESETPKISASSISGLLLVPVEGRVCAITFGHAWQKMKPKFIEPNFGIRCVLNLAERNSLRAIKRDRVSEDFIQAIEQIPDSDEIDRFGMDVERDLLRGIKAKVQSSKEFGAWVAGGDSFKASVDLTAESIHGFLSRCISLWMRTDYQKEFAWVDNISPVRDDVLEFSLMEALVAAIKVDHSKFVLCIPDLLAWDDFDLFAFQAKKKGHAPCADNLDLEMWVNWCLGKGEVVDLATLSSNHIYAYKDDGSPVQRWPVIACVHGMLEKDSEHYLVHGGHWFRVNKDFVARINKRVNSIEKSSIELPLPKVKEKEGDYNLRVANASSGTILWMDKKLVSHGGGKSRFEVCDLFTDNGHLICVKPWGQASGSLSHLFAQARVSVQLMNNDPEYREKARNMIAGVDEGFATIWEVVCDDPKEAEVVLAVMRCCPKEALPFFAKLALVNCVDDLRDMRFKATFLELPADI